MIRVFFLAVKIFIFFVPSHCLFEDQIGKFDWRQQYVGKPQFIFWDRSFATGKRIFVATDRNVIASINANNGSLAWRQVFETDNKGRIDACLYHENNLITVTGNGKYVRNWNTRTGILQWQTLLDIETFKYSTVVLYNAENVVAISKSTAFKIQLSNGKLAWDVSLPDSDKIVSRYMAVNGNNLIVIGIASHSTVNIINIGSYGQISSQKAIPAAWINVDTRCVLATQKYLVCLQDETLQFLDVTTGDAFLAFSVQALGLSPSKFDMELKLMEVSAKEIILRLSPNAVSVLQLSDSGIKTLENLPQSPASEMIVFDGKKYLVTIKRTPPEEVSVHVYDMETMKEETELSLQLPFPKSHGLPQQLETLMFRRKDGRLGIRVLIISQDYCIHLAQKSGRVIWRREEALAYITSVEMVDLPVSESEAKFEDEFGSHRGSIFELFYKRFMAQISQLKPKLGGDSPLIFVEHTLHKLRGHRHHTGRVLEDNMDDDDDDEEDLTRDAFNLNKIILAVTSAGKIFGLKSSTGRIMWQHFISDLMPFEKFHKKSLILHVQRTTAHFPLPPFASVLGKSRKSGESMLFSFNPITGIPMKGVPGGITKLGYKVIQTGMLSEFDEHFLKGLIFMDTDLKVHVYPESYRTVLKKHINSVYMYLVDVETGTVSGYRIKIDDNKDLSAEKVWNVNLQRKNQVITNIASKASNEHVHSQGRVLGDRSVLYKYLNPNIVAITAEGEEPGSTIKGAANFLNLYLLDTVTGRIVFSTSHKRTKGPVHIVHSENWVVYHYFNQRYRRHEMAVLEMYEGKEQSNSTAFSSFSAISQPLVMRQAYIFPLAVSALATTITEKGITLKNVLCALKVGSLLSMPKAFFDPRRPAVPTQETMEEGAIPYVPEIPIATEAMVNYNQTLLNIEGIYSAPAGLESTSLVIAYGLDIFFTQATPSKMFDVLKEDFDYLFISSVVIGMVVVSVVSQKLSARRALNRAWK